jgi:hypothetical protein
VSALDEAFKLHSRARRTAEEVDRAHESSTWVGVCLERPLLFVGLSLTREEWTVWWLLSQRARFVARRPAARRPPTFVFARRPGSTEPLEAQGAYATLTRACELLGITLLRFDDFGEGWRKLRRALDWPG